MKINDVIKKCIKIPGISIKQAEYSMELILNTKEGKGSMTFFSLFPGLSLAYIFINSLKSFINKKIPSSNTFNIKIGNNLIN